MGTVYFPRPCSHMFSSEDEDAPSPLTRRLIRTTVERQHSGSLNPASRPSSLYTGGTTSRFASPTPSKPGLIRKDSSYASLRAVSSPAGMAGPRTGLRIPRGRSTSAASAASSAFSDPSSMVATPPLGMTRVPFVHENSSTSSVVITGRAHDESPAVDVSPKTPTSKLPTMFPRSRAESVTSNGSVSTTTSHAPSDSQEVPYAPSPTTPARPIPRPRTSSAASASRTPSKLARPNGIPRPRVASNAPTRTAPANPYIPSIPRPRAESTTSNSTATTTSNTSQTSITTVSEGSQYSSSTASSGSAVPRPLRLPQASALKSPSRSLSQDAVEMSAAQRSALASYQRARTLSNPQSAMRLPISPAQPHIMTTSKSLTSGVLPPGAPPTLRERQAPGGARPQPRTGTGMTYRTTSAYSFASFHESGTKMRGLSLASYAQKGVAI